MRCNDHNGHLLRDQSNGTVFHLSGGITLGVDVTYLLEFERTFHRYGEVVATSEIDEVLGVGESLGEVGDAFVLPEYALDLVGDLSEFAHDAQVLLLAHCAFLFAYAECEHCEGDNLCREGFGGSYADLGAYVGVASAVRDARDRCADDVADREDECTFLFRQLDGCEGVGCLAGLRDSDDYVILVDDGFAVTELAGVLNFDGDLCKLLNGVHGDESGVPRRAASGDDDTFGVEETVFVVDEAGEGDVVLADVHTTAHGVGEGAWLLEDLLEHKVRVTAFLQLGEGEFEALDLRGFCYVVDGGNG